MVAAIPMQHWDRNEWVVVQMPPIIQAELCDHLSNVLSHTYVGDSYKNLCCGPNLT